MSRPELLLTIAGSLHFLQIPTTSHLARRLLKLGPDLAKLSPLNLRIVRIFMAAASLLILGLGIIALLVPPAVWGWSLVRRTVPQRMGLRLISWIAATGLATGVLAFLPAPASWPLKSQMRTPARAARAGGSPPDCCTEIPPSRGSRALT